MEYVGANYISFFFEQKAYFSRGKGNIKNTTLKDIKYVLSNKKEIKK